MYNKLKTADGRTVILPVPESKLFYSSSIYDMPHKFKYCGKCYSPMQKHPIIKTVDSYGNIVYVKDPRTVVDIPCTFRQYADRSYYPEKHYSSTIESNNFLELMVDKNNANSENSVSAHECYTDADSGFLFCKKCGTSLERYLFKDENTVYAYPNSSEYGKLAGKAIKMRTLCKCRDEEKLKNTVKSNYNSRIERLEKLRKNSIKDKRFLNYRFDNDDGGNSELMTFCCKFDRYKLLVIDDLGVERITSFAAEQIYSVIDGRVKNGKPLIITTNYSPEEIINSPSIENQRIFSRIMELCTPFRVVGENRRKKICTEKSKLLFDLLDMKSKYDHIP